MFLAFKISATWSDVTASNPQPNDVNWINCKLGCDETNEAAWYILEWYVHWSTTRNSSNSLSKWQTLSSVKTAMPSPVIKSANPWLISGSTWYGLPDKTTPVILFSFKYARTVSPSPWISKRHCCNSS